jgi:hypothetical protein
MEQAAGSLKWSHLIPEREPEKRLSFALLMVVIVMVLLLRLLLDGRTFANKLFTSLGPVLQ